MLFNSPAFLLIFLPLSLLLFVLCGRLGRRFQIHALIVSSLVFYSYWKPAYLAVLLSSIGGACVFAFLMQRSVSERARGFFLLAGIAFCLGILGYYKYGFFLLDNLGLAFGFPVTGRRLELPIGISFYTFTAIAFLVDVSRRRLASFTTAEYAATITYFPHLVAGPILYHHDTIPQLRNPRAFFPDRDSLLLFALFFSVGLFKKCCLADFIARYSDPIYAAVAAGGSPDAGQAWRAALCYSFQLYFDFSGYSDMAIGLSNLFGIKIPVNFYSPYRSVNLAEFWRRWHISLGYFLRTYVYIPLGGSRCGQTRSLANLLLVMLLCGVWHGAGWTFILWGALHGVGLVVQRLWSRFVRLPQGLLFHGASVLLTFLFVVAGWVLFRSSSVQDAGVILTAMSGLGSGTIAGLAAGSSELFLAAAAAIAWFLPNTYQLSRALAPAILLNRNQEEEGSGRGLSRLFAAFAAKPYAFGVLGAASGILLVIGVVSMSVNGQMHYLYFDF